MRRFATCLLATLILPASAVAQDGGSLCQRMIDETAERVPEAGTASGQGQGPSPAQIEAVRATLGTARSVGETDEGACMTLVNAARTILTRSTAGIPAEAVSVTDLSAWSYDPLYANAWRVDRLIDADVYSEDGEEIGEVEDILMAPDGTLTGIVVEGGGFLDIGDSHVRVAWEDVTFREGAMNGAPEGVVVPLTDETLTDYSLFTNGDAGPDIRPDEFRVSRVVNEPVRFREGAAYGYIEDLLVSDGKVEALVIRPDVAYAGRRGPAAMPYYQDRYGYGYGYGYGSYGAYVMPYAREDIDRLPTLELERIQGPGMSGESGSEGEDASDKG